VSDDAYTRKYIGGEAIRYETKLRAKLSRHALLLLPTGLLACALWRLSVVTPAPMLAFAIVPFVVTLASVREGDRDRAGE
jgi:hypothetical protein